METRLFDPSNPPEWTSPHFYEERERAPHLEQTAHRGRLQVASEYVLSTIGEQGAVDFGAGDGGLLSLVRDGAPDACLVGYDLQPANVAGAAERGVNVRLFDVTRFNSMTFPPASVAVTTEFLEHLVDPHAFLRALSGAYTHLVASSPYGETEGSHYELHLWCWDEDGYEAMLSDAGWKALEHRVIDGFQVFLCERTVPVAELSGTAQDEGT